MRFRISFKLAKIKILTCKALKAVSGPSESVTVAENDQSDLCYSLLKIISQTPSVDNRRAWHAAAPPGPLREEVSNGPAGEWHLEASHDTGRGLGAPIKNIIEQ